MSYGECKRDGGYEIACAYFFSLMADWRGLKLCSMLYCHLTFVDGRIARMGGSSNFSELWWIHRGGGCEIAGAHFSS
jgi:hypothetical protein